MSALAAPPSPRLRAASAASAQEAAAQRLEGARAGRSHLRLVTPDFVPEEASALREGRPAGPAPVRIGQRAAGRKEAVAGPETSGSASTAVTYERQAAGAVAGASLQELAPHHPAVRAQRQRGLLQGESRRGQAGRLASDREGVQPGRADRRAAAQPVRGRQEILWERRAQESKTQSSRQTLPVALRRLLVLAGTVVAAVVLVAGGIVLSGFVSEPVAGGTTTVRQGESLWDIASATGTQDVSAAVSQIVELNNLDSTTLQAGQTLVLPAG
ncbi:LysM peptidoglycan-binding domain-containing protein [Actinomyces faecalis]|uniref:LysM peptidoglycan-binding domain-containing protein n=1 Tax=Actinomyces faecalis TaxID=2722820 RepID=UPI0015524A38|nr:LysM peptidoglycan-binding domain-containing protein [Actinomyces faecalis]